MHCAPRPLNSDAGQNTASTAVLQAFSLANGEAFTKTAGVLRCRGERRGMNDECSSWQRFHRIRSTGQKTYNHCATQVPPGGMRTPKCASRLSALESRQSSVQNQIFAYKENSVQGPGEAGFTARQGQKSGFRASRNLTSLVCYS